MSHESPSRVSARHLGLREATETFVLTRGEARPVRLRKSTLPTDFVDPTDPSIRFGHSRHSGASHNLGLD